MLWMKVQLSLNAAMAQDLHTIALLFAILRISKVILMEEKKKQVNLS